MIAAVGIALAVAVAMGSGALSGQAPPGAPQPGEGMRSAAPPKADYEAEHARTRAAVAEVLARREFRNLEADPYAFQRWLAEWFLRLFSGIGSALGSLPPWAAWVIVAWMLLTLAAILAHLIYLLWRVLGGVGRPSLSSASALRHPGELLGIRDLEFDSVYAEACRLLAAGQWLAATKYLYVAAILWLDREGSIVFRPAKTNRDYLRELQPRSRLHDPFRGLTEHFERIVYGGQLATESTTHEMANSVEGLRHESIRTVAS